MTDRPPMTFKAWQWVELLVLVLCILGMGALVLGGHNSLMMLASAAIWVVLLHITSWLLPVVRHARDR